MTQKEKILKLLREAGSEGISSFGQAREIALQLPTRIKELKKSGYNIVSIPQKDRSVKYYLLSEPTESGKKLVRNELEFYFVDNVAYRKVNPVQNNLNFGAPDFKN